MASLLIQHSVKDFSAWKQVFDSVAGIRASSGEVSAKVFRDESDPNKVTVLNQWDTMANAQKFVHSPELRAAMEKAGVVGQPNIFFLNEE
jgi:quinol monooxygenase YgiN